MEEQEISIGEIIKIIKKRWKIVAIMGLLAVAVAVAANTFILKPVYQVKTKAFIGKEDGQEGYNSSDISMYQQLIKTYSETIKTKNLINRAIESSGYNISAQEVLDGLSVNPLANTQILEITYKNEDPEFAVGILKYIANEFVLMSKELVPNGNVLIIEDVEMPTRPIAPNKGLNILIALALGVISALGYIFVAEYLDNTYDSKESLEKELGIPVLGVIPKVE